MRPHIDKKTSKDQIDESTDTYDTIEWLLAHIPNHNGNVGMIGGSYSGFYCSAGMIDAHPALKAVSPQAPIADWFFDDFHHHGALFLPHTFNFFADFGLPRPKATAQRPRARRYTTMDAYQFFLDLGPLSNVNRRYFNHNIAFWDELCAHPNYDRFWQDRNLLPHLKKVAPAVMTVGGWFDAEDLYGPLKTYRAIKKQNRETRNFIVMGPWGHGGWLDYDDLSGTSTVGCMEFKTDSGSFRRDIEKPFFDHFLKVRGKLDLPEAIMFDTGADQWRKFDQWPPSHLQRRELFFHGRGLLSFEQPTEPNESYDQYLSDPRKPVPYTEVIAPYMHEDYMTDDQRFATRRPDVLSYQSDILKEDITLAGPLLAKLWASTSGTDSDWVVKLIDVFPPDAPDFRNMPPGRHMGGYQMMIRSEVIRGRFRNSYEYPEPFIPNQPTRVNLELQDVLHTFKKRHCIMVQIQSSWFPLVDRNPQKYVDNIYLHADEKDFVTATERVYRSKQRPSCLEVAILSAAR